MLTAQLTAALPASFPLERYQEWWCSCAGQFSSAAFLYEEEEDVALSREPWIDLNVPEDAALATRAFNAMHAGCHYLPKKLWNYWSHDFDMDEDDYHGPKDYYYRQKADDQGASTLVGLSARCTDRLCTLSLRFRLAEWLDLGKVYCAVAERFKERRVPESWHARLREVRARVVELVREDVKWSASGTLNALDRVWKRVADHPTLVYAPPDDLKNALSLIMSDRLLEFIGYKLHHAKLVVFMRIAVTLRADEPTALPTAIRSLLDSVDTSDSTPEGPGLLETHFAGHEQEIDEIMARATTLLRCGFCSRKLSFEQIAEHVIDEHGAGPVAPFALVPQKGFRDAVRSLLNSLQMPSTTALTDIRTIKVTVDELMPSGLTLTSHGVPFEEAVRDFFICASHAALDS